MFMERIPSFNIDHTKLKRGLYVSRYDKVGEEYITTFDIRIKEPNNEPAMTPAVTHTIEHLAATYLRNSNIKDKIVYFGPMGCLTGFYLIVKGKWNSKQILPCILSLFSKMYEHEGDIPGASAIECGNYTLMDKEGALAECDKFLMEVLLGITDERLNYPSF